MSRANFIADENGLPTLLNYIVQNGSAKQDARTSGLIALSSDSSNFTDKSKSIGKGYVMCKKTDKAEGYVFRDIENVTIDHGLPSSQTGMPEPVYDDAYTISQLYRFVKKVNRSDGGIKYWPNEKATYGFTYSKRKQILCPYNKNSR